MAILTLIVRRESTDSDIMCFTATFHHLGYEVYICKNYSAAEIMNEVNHIVGLNHMAYDSIMLCFTTHGENNHFHLWFQQRYSQTLAECVQFS